MLSSKLSTTLPHDNLVTFFKMTELLHFCNKIEKCLLHLFLKACSFDLPSASTDFFDKSFKNLSASFTDRQTETDRQQDRHTDSKTDTQTARQTHRQTARQTDRQQDRRTDRDRQTDSKTDTQTARQTDSQPARQKPLE